MPRGASLRLAVANCPASVDPGSVELTLTGPPGAALASLETLAGLARAAGGTAEPVADGLRITLPGEPPKA
jgi:hypothetical protein